MRATRGAALAGRPPLDPPAAPRRLRTADRHVHHLLHRAARWRHLRARLGRPVPAPVSILARARPPVPPSSAPRRLRAEAGQSTIEILGLLPLLVVVVLAAAELLAAGAARSSASSAAEAAAMAVLQGGDPSAAARAAAPGWTHPRLAVTTSGRHVRVRLTPPNLLPGLAGPLTTTAEADAGPAAAS